MRMLIFANGDLNISGAIQVTQNDFVIAADGGARHCLKLGITPHVVIGDLDSLSESEIHSLEEKQIKIIRHPVRKDFTDLELALQHAVSLGADEILIWAALGNRWDQTLANILLPVAPGLSKATIRLIDGLQEISLLRPGQPLLIRGFPGDVVSLISISGDAHGVSTTGLEYPLQSETLYFGATRGVSNVFQAQEASVILESGLLLVIINRQIHLQPE